MKKLAIIFLISCIGFSTNGQIIHVPADYPTIQQGIDAAGIWGDTVLVDAGTYFENIRFNGKRIMVTSNFIFSEDTMDIINTVIDGSQPSYPDFGSVVLFDAFEDTTSIICGFTITGGTGTYVPAVDVTGGGGIAISYSGAKIINNYIEYNSVNGNNADGGAIGFGPPGDPNFLVIRNNKIRYNEAIGTLSAYGGAITCGNAIISDNIIQGNIAKNLESGSIYVASGGGINQTGYDSPDPFYIEFTNNIIYGNKAISESADDWEGRGGGMSIYNVYGIIRNNTITGNEISAVNNCLGCGINCMHADTTLLIECNTIANNYFSDGECIGGGIFLYNASAKFINNMIHHNQSTRGGGMYLWDEQGGSGNSQIINNTITNNHAVDDGGALYNDNTVTYIFNSIIWNNESSGGEELSGDYEVRYSDIDGGFEGEGNIDEDPDFVDPDNDDFHIPEESPCATAGMEVIRINGTWLYCPEFDFEGDPRPWETGTPPDMGADEVLNIVSIVHHEITKDIQLQLYPNPASGTTCLRYLIHDIGYLISDLFDISGRRILRLIEEEQVPGTHEIEIDVSTLPAGVYFIRVQVGDDVAVQKLLVVE